MPHVIEPAVGLDRLMLAFITSAYAEEAVGDEVRVVMRFHEQVAPYRLAVLPLLGKPDLVAAATQLHAHLLDASAVPVDYDAAGSIGVWGRSVSPHSHIFVQANGTADTMK